MTDHVEPSDVRQPVTMTGLIITQGSEDAALCEPSGACAMPVDGHALVPPEATPPEVESAAP